MPLSRARPRFAAARNRPAADPRSTRTFLKTSAREDKYCECTRTSIITLIAAALHALRGFRHPPLRGAKSSRRRRRGEPRSDGACAVTALMSGQKISMKQYVRSVHSCHWRGAGFSSPAAISRLPYPSFGAGYEVGASTAFRTDSLTLACSRSTLNSVWVTISQ